MARQGTKVLLLYPQHPDTFWSYKYALKFISKKASSPPLGLLTVAAMLPGGLGNKAYRHPDNTA